MAMQLDPNDKNFPKVLATKQAVASSILTASVRLGDASLRKKSSDKVQDLLDELRGVDAARELLS
jgi:hypothetical protein